jgi:hypothetical protein
MKAITMYRKFHPGIGQQMPTLEELICWLLYDKSVVNFASELTERMGRIHYLAMQPGEVEAGTVTAIDANDLINIRLLSQVGLSYCPRGVGLLITIKR